MLTMLLLMACSGDPEPPPEPTDHFAPPPLPEGLQVDETEQALVAIVGHSIEPSQVGDWIGMAEDEVELRERLFAATVVPVEAMTLRVGPWSPAALSLLVNSPELDSLVRLEASGAELGEEGGPVLLGAGWLSQIEELRLNGCALEHAAIETLAAQPSLEQLKLLSLASNGLGHASVNTLIEAPGIRELQELDLSGNRVGDRGARAIAASPRSGTLKVLDLRDNGITDEGAFNLASARGLADLEKLDLRGNPIGKKGKDALLVAYTDGTVVLD